MKSLRNIKLFEEFSAANEAWEDAVSTRKVNVDKKFKEDVIALDAAADAYFEFEKSIKEKHDLLKAAYEDKASSVEATMKKLGANMITIKEGTKKILVELKTKEGITSKSYKNIAEATAKLLPKTEEMTKKLKEIDTEFTKKNPDKTDLKVSKVEEGISDVLKSIGNWFKTAFNKIKNMLPDFTKATDEFDAAVKTL